MLNGSLYQSSVELSQNHIGTQFICKVLLRQRQIDLGHYPQVPQGGTWISVCKVSA